MMVNLLSTETMQRRQRKDHRPHMVVVRIVRLVGDDFCRNGILFKCYFASAFGGPAVACRSRDPMINYRIANLGTFHIIPGSPHRHVHSYLQRVPFISVRR